jgi:hypothetical protein
MYTLSQMEVHRSTQTLSVSLFYTATRPTTVLEKLLHYTGALTSRQRGEIKSNKVENELV